MPAIAGVATSTTRSASRARSSTLVVSAEEARTMRMFAGRRCRNNSRMKVSSVAAALVVAFGAATARVSGHQVPRRSGVVEFCVAQMSLYA